MSLFAIASPLDQKKITLLCRGTDRRFTVLNGGWVGSYDDGVITIKKTGDTRFGFIVWRGELPAHVADDYHDAIAWIEAQLKAA